MVQDQTNVVVIVGSMHANVEGIYNVLNNSGMDTSFRPIFAHPQSHEKMISPEICR
jgi:hypothetical protein